LQLHFQPADLLEQLGLTRLVVGGVYCGAVGEDRLSPAEELLVAGVDAGGVDAE